MTDATVQPCAPSACWLAHQWWGHDGHYCTQHSTCWRVVCHPTPVTISTTSTAA